MKRTYFFLLTICLTSFSLSPAQSLKDTALDYLKQIHKPQSLEAFKPLPHLPPLNQDTTNACWSFATLSFVESEMLRLGKPSVKLAMMYPVYFAFVEKGRYFVQTKGHSHFAPGDLFPGVLETIKKYGIVPVKAYKGQTGSCKTFNHTALEKELNTLMRRVKALELWDEDLVTAKIRQILDKHLGVPPQAFEFNGKEYTPLSFRDEVVSLPWNDYLMVTSFMYAPFYEFSELKVPDNWAHNDRYFNVPLDVFYQSLKEAVQKGYSVAFDSDTGEPGRIGREDAVFVPPFDIPGRFINQQAREFRFNNKSTTDDHLMHIIGYKQIEGQDWFLVKDSWRSAWVGQYKGYYFFHADYIKLKALAYLVHRDAIPMIAEKIRD